MVGVVRTGLRTVIQVHTGPIERRVVGQHRAVNQAAVFHVHGTTVGVGIVIVNQRRLHTAVFQVHTAAIAGGIIFPDNTVGQVGIGAVHIYAGTAVGQEVVLPRIALRISALNGNAVKRGDARKVRLARHGSEPHHVARIAAHGPF